MDEPIVTISSYSPSSEPSAVSPSAEEISEETTLVDDTTAADITAEAPETLESVGTADDTEIVERLDQIIFVEKSIYTLLIVAIGGFCGIKLLWTLFNKWFFGGV